ncbi:MAG: cupin domain-containing protein [Chthoniobacteraceae bacterium]
MITEHQQEQAGLYALGALPEVEREAFEIELRADAELREFTRSLMRAADAIALTSPRVKLPAGLKASVLRRIDAEVAQSAPAGISRDAMANPALGLSFLMAAGTTAWKQLPIPGAWIKLLSLERERGYAVLLGRLDPGTRYPAHMNAGPEDFYVLSGDLHIGATRLNGGDFHHADGGSWHEENWSEAGCTLLAVLTLDDPLVAFAMA